MIELPVTPSTRLQVRVSLPALKPDAARKFWAQVQSAEREGRRIEYPISRTVG